MVECYENLREAKSQIVKWISVLKEDLDASGKTKPDISDKKPLGGKFARD